MKSLFSFVVVGMVLILFVLPCNGAQSTADVSASAELKKKTRLEILKARTTDETGIEEYIVGQGDSLSVSIYGEGNMAASITSAENAGRDENGVQVRVDGRISLKHVGDVHAADLTLTELADYLKVLYATIYDDPIITTVLLEGASKRYTMMGKVITQGIFPLNSQVSLVQAVASSGGFNEWANNEITVVRERVKDQDKQVFKGNTLKFDYDDFLNGKNLQKNVSIRPGDIIIVH